MENASSVRELAERGHRRIALACGVFDGVHRGHQCILDELRSLAVRHRAAPVALTFNPHPRVILSHCTPPRVLTTPWQKTRLLKQCGAREVVLMRFSHHLASLDGETFVRRHLLPAEVSVVGLCVGESWRFGSSGEGDVDFLRDLGEQLGFEVVAVPELTWYRKPVSSTRIRGAIQNGRLDQARKMLGRAYRVCGHVIHGKGIGSRRLNCPTANLADPMILLPPSGVYAARSLVHSEKEQSAPRALDGVVYIGSAPTFVGDSATAMPPSLELHLLDFDEDIYGARIEVEFEGLLRPEVTFGSEQELEHQIQLDIAEARKRLANRGA